MVKAIAIYRFITPNIFVKCSYIRIAFFVLHNRTTLIITNNILSVFAHMAKKITKKSQKEKPLKVKLTADGLLGLMARTPKPKAKKEK
jgi:biotin synthase-like enzyme